jgi:hypothetical protein
MFGTGQCGWVRLSSRGESENALKSFGVQWMAIDCFPSNRFYQPRFNQPDSIISTFFRSHYLKWLTERFYNLVLY